MNQRVDVVEVLVDGVEPLMPDVPLLLPLLPIEPELPGVVLLLSEEPGVLPPPEVLPPLLLPPEVEPPLLPIAPVLPEPDVPPLVEGDVLPEAPEVVGAPSRLLHAASESAAATTNVKVAHLVRDAFIRKLLEWRVVRKSQGPSQPYEAL